MKTACSTLSLEIKSPFFFHEIQAKSEASRTTWANPKRHRGLHDPQLLFPLLPILLTSSLSLHIIIDSLALNRHRRPILTRIHLIRQHRPRDHRLCRREHRRKEHVDQRRDDETKDPRERVRSFPNPDSDRGIDAVDEAWEVRSDAYDESGDGAPVDAVGVTVYAVVLSEQVFCYEGAGSLGRTLRDDTKRQRRTSSCEPTRNPTPRSRQSGPERRCKPT